MSELKGGMTGEEALALQAIWEEIQGIDLSAIEAERERRKTSIERIVEDVKLGKSFERKLARKNPVGRPKLHWKTRIANRKATKAKYYQNTWKPRRKAELAEQLTTSKGWYEHCKEQWKGEVMGYRQWNTHIWPMLKGRVPVFKRDDTKKGWTLDNVVVYESGTRNVICTPEDYKLRLMGAYSEE